MYLFIIGLIIFVSILLVLAVLAQNAKGGGLSSGFAGAGSSQLMGVKRTSDFLEQVTWGLAITLIVLTLSTSFMMDMSGAEEDTRSINVERAQERGTLPQGGIAPAPGTTTPGTTAPATTPGTTTPGTTAPATTDTTP